jgi:protein gp37
MGAETKIEWTERTWNPVGGCRKVSPGCKNCYAIRVARRLAGNPTKKIARRYSGLTQIEGGKPNWTGKTFIDEEVLLEPLRRRKPTTYFISLSDLFYDERPDEDIDRVFAVMALAQWHVFQILTKYPERMLCWFNRDGRQRRNSVYNRAFLLSSVQQLPVPNQWPLPNLWLGVSVEDQKHADERIPLLLRTPAALRFVSYEPALGPVDFTRIGNGSRFDGTRGKDVLRRWDRLTEMQSLDWIIVGGESGPGARSCNIEWIRSAVQQCKAARVPVFCKQAGSFALLDGERLMLKDRKGGNMSELPSDIQIREMPNAIR